MERVLRKEEGAGGPRGPSVLSASGGLLKRWAALGLCLLVLWVFVFVVAPLLEQVPAVGRITSYVERSGIDASALYYTELEETAEAEMHLRDAATYAPRSRGSSDE